MSPQRVLTIPKEVAVTPISHHFTTNQPDTQGTVIFNGSIWAHKNHRKTCWPGSSNTWLLHGRNALRRLRRLAPSELLMDDLDDFDFDDEPRDLTWSWRYVSLCFWVEKRGGF